MNKRTRATSRIGDVNQESHDGFQTRTTKGPGASTSMAHAHHRKPTRPTAQANSPTCLNRCGSIVARSRRPRSILPRLAVGVAAVGLGLSLLACGAQGEDYVGEASNCIASNAASVIDHDVVVLVDRHSNGNVTGYFGSTYFTVGEPFMLMSELEDVETDEGLSFVSQSNIQDRRFDVEAALKTGGGGELEGEITYSANGVDITCDMTVELE